MRQLQLEELGRIGEEAFKSLPKIPLVVALDNVRSGHNVGAVFRTADAFRIESVILGGYTPCPPEPEIQKTALGATETVQWRQAEDLAAVLLHYKEKGYTIWAAEQTDQPVLLHRSPFDAAARHVLVLGNEVRGVSPEILALCDSAIEIPQEGTKHSLNVSVAAGILMWEFYKQLS
ncbi:MAG: RNA methyltransferase [Flavobacteriales bacterium]